MVSTGRIPTATPTDNATLTGLGFTAKYVRGTGWLIGCPDGRTRVIKSPSEWWAREIAKNYKGVDAEILAEGFAQAAQNHADAQQAVKKADSVAANLIELAKGGVLELFRDQYKTGFARIDLSACGDVVTVVTNSPPSLEKFEGEGEVSKSLEAPENITTFTTSPHIRNVELQSKTFKQWLSRQYYKTTGDAPGSDAISSAINVLEAEAQITPEKTLYNRVAPDGVINIYIDMGDDAGRAIHVTPEGWEIVDNPPPIFYRYDHMKALPEPVRGGSLARLIPYLRLERGGDMLLASVKIAGDFIPNIPWPNTAVIGASGSGKSSFQQLEQSLIDPSKTDLLGLPDEDKELLHDLSTHYLSNWDNISHLSRPQSDRFCRAITGSAMDARLLYTNNDSYIQAFMRKIGMSGVNTMLSATDLFSRTIVLNWILRGETIDENTFKVRVAADAPELLGGILDWLVKAMKEYPNTKANTGFRMGSFTRWGIAFSKAIGIDEAIFVKAYRENLKLQDIEAIKASPMTEYLIRYIRSTGKTTIEAYAAELKFDIEEWWENTLPVDKYNNSIGEKLPHKYGWPPNANVFGRELNEISAALLSQGIKIRRDTLRKGTKYTITVTASGGDSDIQKTLDDNIIPDAIPPEEFAKKLGYEGEVPQIVTDPTDATSDTKPLAPNETRGDEAAKLNLAEVCEKLVAAFININAPATVAELAEKSGLPETDIETVLEKVYRPRGEATFDVASDKWRWWTP